MNGSTSNAAASNAATAKVFSICVPSEGVGEKNPKQTSNKPATPTLMIPRFFPA